MGIEVFITKGKKTNDSEKKVKIGDIKNKLLSWRIDFKENLLSMLWFIQVNFGELSKVIIEKRLGWECGNLQ